MMSLRLAPVLLPAFALALFPAPAPAQEHMDHQPSCPAEAEPLPAPVAGWAHRIPMIAGTDAAKLSAATLPIGSGVDLTLSPTPSLKYARRPENPGGSVSAGGMVLVKIAQAGTYRVGISSAAWLDVVKDGTALVSVNHGHGPNCTGLRKMVDFTLTPGDYVVQIAGSGMPSIGLIVAKLP